MAKRDGLGRAFSGVSGEVRWNEIGVSMKKNFTFQIYDNFEEMDKDEIEYYHSLTPLERLAILKKLRQQFYDENIQGIPRFFEVVKREGA
jgi:hypothetical protein